MNKKEIIKGNKLIAKFLEWPIEGGIIESGIGAWVETKDMGTNYFGWNFSLLPEQLEFHSSYDWLIEAISEITKLTEFQDLYADNSLFWDTFCHLNIEETYKEVIKFIKWYNDLKTS